MAYVTRSVQLNRKLCLWAKEIDDPVTERMLPTKLQVGDLPVTQT
jgi:hypothetical protein